MSSGEGTAKEKNRVPTTELRWSCPDGCLEFDTTDGIAPIQGTIGQDRALKALRVGLELYAPGYNIYVSGLVGTGRTSTVKNLLEEISPRCAVPRDRAYVHNFGDPDRPRLISFPAGGATVFRKDVEQFVTHLKNHLPAVFEGKEIAEQRDAIVNRFGEREQEHLKEFQERLNEEGLALVTVQSGPVPQPDIFPMYGEKPMPLNQFAELIEKGELTQERLDEIKQKIDEARSELRDHLRRGRDLARKMSKEIEDLHRNVGLSAIAGELEDLRATWPGNEAIQTFLQELEADVLENLPILAQGDESSEAQQREEVYRRYEVNVISDRSQQQGCPMVISQHPTHSLLFGTIEREWVAPGYWRTDHTMVKGGALLEADGGYLILNALDVLTQPGVWQTLMRSLKSGKLEIQVPEFPFMGMPTGLKPEPINIMVKVILIGEPRYHHLLYRHDPDFRKIFKVKADFIPDMDLGEESLDHFAKVLARICETEDLSPLSRTALGRVAEQSVRAAGRRDKISTRFADAADIVREADYWRGEAGEKLITDEHVEQAIREREFRNSAVDSRMQELMEDDTLIIRTDGEAVGQVNGLSVLDLGYHMFGKPTLISATTAVGQAGIINVEREARLSGGIYDKGVLIISGYLRRLFAQQRPLALTASLCFEQSYAGVDGDSASIAEIFALLSDLSDIPIHQGIAVTGSISQRGEIQPVGGVNEKIEGFFGLCYARGLTGEQGVILPSRNVGDLMLSPEVVRAVEEGKFHIYGVSRVEDGIEILTGVPAGERGEDGRYPEGSVFAAVDERLEQFLDALRGREEQDWKPIQTVPGAPEPAPTRPPPDFPPRPPIADGSEDG